MNKDKLLQLSQLLSEFTLDLATNNSVMPYANTGELEPAIQLLTDAKALVRSEIVLIDMKEKS